MASPEPGAEFMHDNPTGMGYGQSHHEQQELTAEMNHLDLKNGAVVKFMQDDDEGWRIVSWVDDSSIDRITAIEPAYFEANFTPV